MAVENHLPGTLLHLGDGRRLACGETGSVPETIADLLVTRGQARRIDPADPKQKEQPA